MADRFTWFEKFTNVLDKIEQEGDRVRLMEAIVDYGSRGIEPKLDGMLAIAFEGIREDIDNSKRFRSYGKLGGRPRKSPAVDEWSKYD